MPTITASKDKPLMFGKGKELPKEIKESLKNGGLPFTASNWTSDQNEDVVTNMVPEQPAPVVAGVAPKKGSKIVKAIKKVVGKK